MNVAIVDYGSGNLHSAAKAFERAGREAGLAAQITVTSDPDRVSRADRIVLPGVGAFADCSVAWPKSTAWWRRSTSWCARRVGHFSASALACSSWPSVDRHTR